MKIILKSFVFTIVVVSMFSCSGTKQAASNFDKSTELTEKQKYQQSDAFVKAVAEKEQGNLERSLELLDKALEFNPNDPATLYEKARIMLAYGRTDEALLYAKSAVQLDGTNKWYRVLYANLLKKSGKYNEHLKEYELLVNEHPTDLNFLNELAFAYYYTGDYQSAIVGYNKIEKLVGVNESLTTQKVQLYTTLGEKEKAVAEYEKLINLNPGESRYYALLAEYCTKNQMHDKAIWAYEKIVEINPEDPYVHISLADYYKKTGDDLRSFEELKLGLANPKLDLKTKVNLLITYYTGQLTDEQRKQALELSEILRQTHPDEALSETFYASMLYENKEYEKARLLLRDILKEDASNYALWEQLLFCDLYLEDNENLAEDAENVVDLFPTYPLPYFFAGIANFQLKDFVKAKAFLESGVDFVVNNNALLEQFYSSLGDTYNELENYDASYTAYDKSLKLNPENSIVLNNYAYYLSLRSANLDKAAEMARKSVELDPYNHNNLDTYAWVLYKQGKYNEALNWIEKAHGNGGSESGVVLEHYGDIYFKLKNTKEAMNYWKQAKTKNDYSDLLDKKIKDKKLYE